MNGIMDLNHEIANINHETGLLHPSAHEFWEQEGIHQEFISYLRRFAKYKVACLKKNKFSKTILKGRNDNVEEMEIGFVDGLFDM